MKVMRAGSTMHEMLAFFVLFLVVLEGSGKQHQCEDTSHTLEAPRVPRTCKVERESEDCIRGYRCDKEGKYATTTEPWIDEDFIKCHEGFTLCAYVSVEGGKVLGNSGATIGAGVDLGSKTKNSKEFEGLDKGLLEKLEPYFGLKREDAACAVIERPLILTVEEANNLTNAVLKYHIKRTATKYNEDKKEKSLDFYSLPRGVRTAVVSVLYQLNNPGKLPKFWGNTTANDWPGLEHELRNFYDKPQAKGVLKRRNAEADLVKNSFPKCNPAMDAVILLDESGSVSRDSFQDSLKFVKDLIHAFSNENLQDELGTRFALSAFASSYRNIFNLSTYKNHVKYNAAINNVTQKRGSTYLGKALAEIRRDQFKENKGIRGRDQGLLRVLIVLTDGKSHDSVSSAAKSLRDEGIIIYAIGVGGYNVTQLKQMASSYDGKKQHVYTLDNFEELRSFAARMTSTSCCESKKLSTNETITTFVSKNEFAYYRYDVNVKDNLEVKVKDLSGNTRIYMSRSNPHPDEFHHDLAFDTSLQKDKVLVLAPVKRIPTVITKRSTDYDTSSKPIYISVTSDDKLAKFTIEGNTCNPAVCKEGTNERLRSGSKIIFSQSFVLMTVAMIAVTFYN